MTATNRLAYWLTRLRTEAVWLVSLLIVYLVVQTFFLQPPSLSDEMSYFKSALNPLKPSTADYVHQELRIGLILPVMLGLKIWGTSEAAYYFLPYLAGILLITATYLLGRSLFNRGVGVCSALLLAVNPFILQESGQLMPDTMGTACYTMGLALLVVACRLWQKQQAGEERHSLVPWLLCSGLFFGWSYLVREFILILSPLILVIFGLYKLPWRNLLWLLLPFFACLGLECYWGWLVYGDPLVRMTTATAPRQVSEATKDILHGFDVVKALPTSMMLHPKGKLFVWWIGVFLAGAFWVRQKRSYLLLIFWFLTIWGFFTALGLFPYGEGKTLLRVQKLRYWFPVFPAIWIGLVTALADLYQRLRTTACPPLILRTAAAGLLIWGFWVSLHATTLVPHKYVLQGENHYWQLRDWLASPEGQKRKQIWTDSDFVTYLKLYSRTFWGQPIWHGDIKVFNHNKHLHPHGFVKKYVPVEQIQSGSLILHKASLQVALVPPKGKSFEFNRPFIPQYLWHVPENWHLLLATPSLDWQYHKHRSGGEIQIFDLGASRSLQNAPLETGDWRVFHYEDPSATFPQVPVPFVPKGQGDQIAVPAGEHKYYFRVALKKPLCLNAGQYLHGFLPRLDSEGKSGRIVFACRFQSPNGKAVEDGFGISTYSAPMTGFPAEWVCLPSKAHPDWPLAEVGFRVKGPMTVVFDRPVVKIGQFSQKS